MNLNEPMRMNLIHAINEKRLRFSNTWIGNIICTDEWIITYEQNVFGYYNEGAFLKFDFVSKLWRYLSCNLPPLQHVSMLLVGSRRFIVHGIDETCAGYKTFSGSILGHSIHFKQIGNLSSFGGGSYLAHDSRGYLYTVTGVRSHPDELMVYQFNPRNRLWNQLWGNPELRRDVKPWTENHFVYYGEKLFVFPVIERYFSYYMRYHEYFTSVLVFDLQTNTWLHLDTRPDPRDNTFPEERLYVHLSGPYGLSQCPVERRFVYVTGRRVPEYSGRRLPLNDEENFVRHTWRLDLDSLQWKRLEFRAGSRAIEQGPVVTAISPSGRMYCCERSSARDAQWTETIKRPLRAGSVRVWAGWLRSPATLQDLCWETVLHHFGRTFTRRNVTALQLAEYGLSGHQAKSLLDARPLGFDFTLFY